MRSIYILYSLPEIFHHTLIRDLYNILSVHEKERLSRLVFEDDRNNLIISHSILRYGVGNMFTLSDFYQNIEFNQHKPPQIKDNNVSNPLNLSLSHTKKLAICAISDDTEIGIDAEFFENKDYSDVYQFCLTNNEIREIRSSKDESLEFLHLWAKKESFLKAKKVGLKLDPKYIECSIYNSMVNDLNKSFNDSNEWNVKLLKITSRHACSLAYKGEKSIDLSIKQIFPEELLIFLSNNYK